MLCLRYLLALFTLFPVWSYSVSEAQYLQDVAYAKDGSVEGIIEINKDRLTVKPAGGEPASLARDKVYLAVKSDGSFISFNNPAPRWIENTTHEVHKLITTQALVYAADHVDILGDKVGFQEYYSGRYVSLPREQFVMIIYKTGMHELLTDPQQAARYLANLRTLDHFSRPETERKVKLSDEEQQYFSKRALRKTEALSFYLKVISDKDADVLYQDNAIQEALKLFVDKDKLVEVSSLHREQNITYKIEEYLNNLRMLPYQKIELLWNQIQYINQIKQGPDGNYYGTITVEQVFRAYDKDNKVTYEDFTVKAIEIIIKPFNMIVDGDSIPKWDVFLSNIGVKQTEQL